MISKVSTLGMTREEWLRERSKSIGGSEIGSILGMNPWQSAYALWCERTGKTPRFEGNLQTEVGTALEAFVAGKFAEISGLGHNVMQTHFIYRNDEYPHLHASPDRLIRASRSSNSMLLAGLECKTTSAFNTSRFRGTDFPMQYYAQCVAYMAVLNVDTWYLAVLVGNHEFHIYKVVRDGVPPTTITEADWIEGSITVDQDDFNAIREAADEFWGRLESGIAPPPDGKPSTGEALKELYPRSNGRTIQLPGYVGELNEYTLLKAQKKELDDRIGAIENAIKAEMGEAEKAICGTHTVSWKSSDRPTLDSKRLKTEMPDIYDQYSRTSQSRSFSIK